MSASAGTVGAEPGTSAEAATVPPDASAVAVAVAGAVGRVPRQ
jgi:hypothetical protein